MRLCNDCNKAEATVNGYYCMDCKVKRNKDSRDRNKNFCSCGSEKLKDSNTCRNCNIGRPIKGRKSRFDSCSCGADKCLDSKSCMICYRRSVQSDARVRGPLPDKGEAAIYLLRNSDGIVFYVGSTKSPKDRIDKHRQKYGLKTTMIIVKIVPVEIQWQEEVKAMVDYRSFIKITAATPGRMK